MDLVVMAAEEQMEQVVVEVLVELLVLQQQYLLVLTEDYMVAVEQVVETTQTVEMVKVVH